MHVHLMIVGHGDYEHWDTTYRSRFRDEIMPAAARQLLASGVTFARELGAPLEDILDVKRRIERGEIPGPRLFVSGPFIQHRPYAEYEKEFRWGVTGAADARAKVQKIVDAGVDLIKLIDQDQMTDEEVRAVVETAHKGGRPVVAHGHREDEIRIGLKHGVDCFEHTGLGDRAGLSGGHPRRPAQAQPDARLVPDDRAPLPLGVHGRRLSGAARTTRAGRRGSRPTWSRDIRKSLREHRTGFPTSPSCAGGSRHSRTSSASSGRRASRCSSGPTPGIPGNFHTDSTWRELATWVQLGMTPMQAIAGATRWPAAWLKKEKDIGHARSRALRGCRSRSAATS